MSKQSMAAKAAKFRADMELKKTEYETTYWNRQQRLQKMEERAEMEGGNVDHAWAGYYAHENKAVLASMKKSFTSTRDFESIQVLGEGSFGKVHLVKDKENGAYYALKQMNKQKFRSKNQRANAFGERDILAASDSRWFVGFHASFQDKDYAYMVMEFVPGGDFLFHLCHKRRLTESETRFYMAEALQALHVLHGLGMVHRDIKPDNMVLDREGHLKLLDFGLCKNTKADMPSSPMEGRRPLPAIKEASSAGGGPMLPGAAMRRSEEPGHRRLKTMVGTFEYMAPEVVMGQDYGKEVDLWAVGVMTFECLVGFNIFHTGDERPEEVRHNVKEHQAVLEHWVKTMKAKNEKAMARNEPKRVVELSPAGEDLIRNLVCPVRSRLTSDQCKQHTFFKGVDFSTLHQQKPPIVPKLIGPEDTRYFDPSAAQPLPNPEADERKDANLDWRNFEYSREAAKLSGPDLDLDSFFSTSTSL